jgi:hypothetical protein
MNVVKSLDWRPAGESLTLAIKLIRRVVLPSIPSQPYTQDDYRIGDDGDGDVNSNNTRKRMNELFAADNCFIPEPIVRGTCCCIDLSRTCGSSSTTSERDVYMQHTNLHGRKVTISRCRCTNSIANTVVLVAVVVTVTVAHNVHVSSYRRKRINPMRSRTN